MNDEPRRGDGAADALHGWFLGPRAENADLLERLITEALRDHVFWRRNHHPEDGFTIREADKRREGYEEAVTTLSQELMGLLAELKRGRLTSPSRTPVDSALARFQSWDYI